MNTKLSFLILFVVLGLVAFGGYLFKDVNIESPGPKDAVSEIEAIEKVVVEFGDSLKKVSLLAPKEEVVRAMEEYYAPFVSAELLATWESDPTTAPGREVSSPWPDRIEIDNSYKNERGAYEVKGDVVEVTSDTSPSEAASYPIALTLEERNGAWIITSFSKEPYTSPVTESENTELASIRGSMVCLPHRNTSGPVTLECAYGIKEASTGKHYALDMTPLGAEWWSYAQTGDTVEIKGALVPIAAISSDHWQKYDVVGIMKVESIVKI